VERADLDEFADRILDSYWARPELVGTRPPRRTAHQWARWNLDLMLRWVIEGEAPRETDLDRLRERAQTQLDRGLPVDFVPGNFRRGARFAWNAALAVAEGEEREALLESADLLFEFVDRVTTIYTEAYQAAQGAVPLAEDERLARSLIARLSRNETPVAEEVELAARLGFAFEGALRPLAIALPGPPGPPHLRLAGRLRRFGVVAASEGRWVVGVAKQGASPLLAELELPNQAAVAEAELTAREEIGPVLEEVRMVVAVARDYGHGGIVTVSDYLPELLLRSAPRMAAEIRHRVYGPLRPHPELGQTLDALVEHAFNRGAAASVLPVHRNTLRDRLQRITELTGIDLERTEDRGLAWLAYLYAPVRPGRGR
jgi:hypothetical protein